MSQKTNRLIPHFQKALKRFLKLIDCTQQLQVRENVVGFEKALGAVKVIKGQIQYRSQSLLNLARDYFSCSSDICYGKRFYNDFFLNHHTIALVNNCLKLLSCVVIETALDLMKKDQLFFQLEKIPS